MSNSSVVSLGETRRIVSGSGAGCTELRFLLEPRWPRAVCWDKCGVSGISIHGLVSGVLSTDVRWLVCMHSPVATRVLVCLFIPASLFPAQLRCSVSVGGGTGVLGVCATGLWLWDLCA